MEKKVLLMILDGWGITQNPDVSAPFQAETPFLDSLASRYASCALRTDGEYVGLPEGQMGNSEVGHMNLGAGRVVYQNLVKINKAIREKTFNQETALLEALAYAKQNKKNIHLLGLVSDGGIHSHIDHLKAILDTCQEQWCNQVFVHAFTDGRDCDPKSGFSFLSQLNRYMEKTGWKLASVIGRYYAMDRDKRRDRVKQAYDLLVAAKGETSQDIEATIQAKYEGGITDEFMTSIVMLDATGNPIAKIQAEDVVIFFNYRNDRARQLTQVLSQEDFLDQGMKKLPLYYLTMTNYDKVFHDVHIIYDNDDLKNTLWEVLANANKTQIRVAETEKYPHVTFFFSGGREEPFQGEKRILCPSPKVATYDLQPEMSAFMIRDAILPEIRQKSADFICLNFANGDMVGHTWDMQAAIQACKTVDLCVKDIVSACKEEGYSVLILADHGNCETMRNPDGSPNTSHTTNPVPCILVDDEISKLSDWALSNIAPTILKLMGIEKPGEMTQDALF